MLNQFSRTQLLLGEEAMDKLKNSRVAVFGVGGVGGYVCEALARSGVGTFDLIDDDKVCLTNLNRQIIATRKTVGKYKVEVMKERIMLDNMEISGRLDRSVGRIITRKMQMIFHLMNMIMLSMQSILLPQKSRLLCRRKSTELR